MISRNSKLVSTLIKNRFAAASHQKLLQAGITASFRTYPIEHAICEEEIRDVADWITEILNGKPAAKL
jgi:predicted esterase